MTRNKQQLLDLIDRGAALFLPHLSVDQVIFSYTDQTLKILLLQVAEDQWMLPGGYVHKEEAVDAAAQRNLEERVGLRQGYLKQFHVFGRPDRSFANEIETLFRQLGIPWNPTLWINQRFISVGYYALVDINRARPVPNLFATACDWFDVLELPQLLLDHRQIAETALQQFRNDLETYPMGFHLLPETFTMPELHKVFEAVLGRQMDRSRFQKKMLGFGVFERLEKKRGLAHRSPYLYRHQG